QTSYFTQVGGSFTAFATGNAGWSKAPGIGPIEHIEAQSFFEAVLAISETRAATLKVNASFVDNLNPGNSFNVSLSGPDGSLLNWNAADFAQENGQLNSHTI